MLLTHDFLAITEAVGVTGIFSKWLANNDDDDYSLVEGSMLECLSMGGGAIRLDMVLSINAQV